MVKLMLTAKGKALAKIFLQGWNKNITKEKYA